MGLPWRAGVSKVKIPVERSFPALSCAGEGGAAGRGERREKKGLGEQRIPELCPELPLPRIQRDSAGPAAPRDELRCSAQIHLSFSPVCVWLASQ